MPNGNLPTAEDGLLVPLFDNQKETVELGRRTPIIFDMSDPGTGKTLSHLTLWAERRKNGGGKALVLAPKSILQAAWGNDIDKFLPGTIYSVAWATNRAQAFEEEADIYITNHDAVKWLAKKGGLLDKGYFADFDTLVVDESTAFKHHTSQRSKALRKLAKQFEYRSCLTGTPNPNSVTELWHQTLLLDEGDRFGTSFWRFRPQVQVPEATGPGGMYTKWVDKPGAESAMFDMLRDISIRHRLEECVDIPANHEYAEIFDLSPKLRKQYNTMLQDAILETESGKLVTAVHAASVNQKLLQIAAGGIYMSDGVWAELASERTELVMDLLDPRPTSIVVIMWRWQRELMLKAAKKRGYPVAVIDGSVTSPRKRNEAVEDLQAGRLKALIIHPASAGHGLTLTRAKTTIFASPTYNAEHYKQVFHRIYRAGQTERTETINVLARGTIDEEVYHKKLGGKLTAMKVFMSLVETNKEISLP